MLKHVPAKIIALDLDDTLLKDDLTISDYTVSVLQEAVKRGIYVTLCSGRTDNAILTYVRRLDIAGTQGGRYIIAQNGTSISDLHERKAIYSRVLESDILTHVYRKACELSLVCEVYDASTIYIPYKNEWTDIDVKLSGLNQQVVSDFETFLMKGHPKTVVPGEPEVLQKLQAELKKEIGERCVIFTSKPYFLEVMPKNTGKGEALIWLAEYLGIAQSETVAFGDAMNDESMIRLAGTSIAMKNGLQVIKDMAAHVSEYTNDEDGVARFIQKYVLNR
ncbi:Cof-type HAD-IIB family hydrolase [Treponema sp. HNW]|uniref:Cof-type HAD-IIB family hydrolase n=1 Tax=Treponema sp. HNW TaxID=3116654 RepID=UPI003D12C407